MKAKAEGACAKLQNDVLAIKQQKVWWAGSGLGRRAASGWWGC